MFVNNHFQNRLKHDEEKKVENIQINAERQEKSEAPIAKVMFSLSHYYF